VSDGKKPVKYVYSRFGIAERKLLRADAAQVPA